MTETSESVAAWIGRTETCSDLIASAPAQAAAATLDDDTTPLADGDPLPPLWHWFYFLPKAPQARIGADGHPQRGGFLPPIDLPRRMFAGARLTFAQPLVIGRPAVREGVVRSIQQKTGKSGTLAFVTVGYSIHQDGRLCVEEEQDIVYRAAGAAVPAPLAAPLPPLPAGAWTRTVTPDPVLLFRFSALTFNAHRIHYDRLYATREEGYPGLVVHGPLTALLLVELVRSRAARPVTTFSFRGLAPLFDLAPFRLAGVPTEATVSLEAQGPDGRTAMSASAGLG